MEFCVAFQIPHATRMGKDMVSDAIRDVSQWPNEACPNTECLFTLHRMYVFRMLFGTHPYPILQGAMK